jgi:hypothetical protein
VTVILNEYRRPMTLRRRLDAAARQDGALVTHVWVCVFHEPDQSRLQALLGECSRRHPDVRFHYVASDFDFRYYGRFQMALQAPTEFVYVVDDDIIPAPGYVAHCISHVRELEGAVGTFGWRFPNRQIASYRDGEWLHSLPPRPNVVVPTVASMLCCHFFLKTEWVRHLWADEPLTFRTGEDFYLGRNLFKFGGVNCFVIPTSEEGGRLVEDDEAGVAGTTVGDNIRLRNEIFHAIKGDLA